MCKVTYFVQQCPTCGRRLQVKVEYMGMEVICQHCGGLLTAQDPSLGVSLITPANPVDDALTQADRFLADTPLESNAAADFGYDPLSETY